MHPLNWEYRPDRLRAPALVCAFKGWNDAADAASTALTFVGSTLGARRFATVDAEEFLAFEETIAAPTLPDAECMMKSWPTASVIAPPVPVPVRFSA